MSSEDTDARAVYQVLLSDLARQTHSGMLGSFSRPSYTVI